MACGNLHVFFMLVSVGSDLQTGQKRKIQGSIPARAVGIFPGPVLLVT